MKRFLSLTLMLIMLVSFAVASVGCSTLSLTGSTVKIPYSKLETSPTGKNPDSKFIDAAMDFSIELFKQTIYENISFDENSNPLSEDKSNLVSPLSVMLAMSLLANGAKGETLKELESVLGNGMAIDELNEYLYTFCKNLGDGVKTANSVWFKDTEITLEKLFTGKAKEYYNAELFASKFNGDTVKDINSWVAENTENMIKEVISEINADALMYIINTVLFNGVWKETYDDYHIKRQTFHAVNSKNQMANFLVSEEKYLSYDGLNGFIKPYDGNYSFMALLPDEKTDINEYIVSLTAERFSGLIKSGAETDSTANVFFPEFKSGYEVEMSDILRSMGIKKAFVRESADFSGICDDVVLYVSGVKHFAEIEVNRSGTKAAAATKIEINCGASFEEIHILNFDRPFVYAIIDNNTNLPLFIGSLKEIEE